MLSANHSVYTYIIHNFFFKKRYLYLEVSQKFIRFIRELQ